MTGATLARTADRMRHHARRPLARSPYLWDLAVMSRSGKRATLARRDTAIVIEGFLRCGNTYSVAAFMVANGREHHIGRHLHGAPHLLRAVRMGLPAVLLIRPPEDAVRSYLIRRPTLTASDALLEYLDFYRTCRKGVGGYVVAPFECVITDFGSVIAAVNERFGTAFELYRKTPANEEAAFALVEEMNRLECHGEIRESHVGRPSAERDRAKRRLDDQLQDPWTQWLLTKANTVYEWYLAGAVQPAAGEHATVSPT